MNPDNESKHQSSDGPFGGALLPVHAYQHRRGELGDRRKRYKTDGYEFMRLASRAVVGVSQE